MRWYYGVAVLVLAVILAVIGTTPQPPRSADIDREEFSAGRAMAHIRVLSAAPHPVGSAENAKVRGYIIAELQALGAEVSESAAPLPKTGLDRYERWSGTRPRALTMTNIIATLPGRARDKPALALMAHHDSVWGSPAAADDSAGVASILETLRAIKAQGGAERDIIIIISDAEELGLLGARHFFATNPLADKIGAIINLETRGGGGRTMLFQTSRDNGDAIRLFADAARRPGGASLAVFIYELLPNDTDLTPALKRDYTAYNFSFIGRPGLYHSPAATAANLDQGALQDMGDQALALTHALANSRALPARVPSISFFDMFGFTLIHYGTATGWLLLIVAAGLQIYLLRRGPRKSWKSLLGASAVIILGGGAALYLFNLISGSAAAQVNYYDRLAAIPRLEAQALLICLAALAASAPLWAGQRGNMLALLLALALQIAAPVTAFIVVWPILWAGLAGLLTLSAAQGRPQGRWSLLAGWAGIVASALALGFLLQMGHGMMQGVGADLPMVAALLAALAVPALAPFMPPVKPRRGLLAAGLCLAAALGIALWVRFDPVADTVAAYAMSDHVTARVAGDEQKPRQPR